MKKQYYLFWDGVCSQWALSPFTFGGVEYNTAEQFMMAGKAFVFEDEESLANIMYAQMPNDQKAFGRRVVGFNNEEWFEVAEDIVTVGNVNKFIQNPKLLTSLYTIKENYDIIVEASPYDKIWGIGLAEGDPRCLNEDEWQGLNLLGKCVDKAYDVINTSGHHPEYYAIQERVKEIFNVK